MPYCPFYENSVKVSSERLDMQLRTNLCQARFRNNGTRSHDKSWPLFENVTTSLQQISTWLSGPSTLLEVTRPWPKYLQHQLQQCLPSWWVVLHGGYQQAHATLQTPSQGASAEATWKQDSHCTMHWLSDSYEFLFLSRQSLQIYGTQPTSQFSMIFPLLASLDFLTVFNG